MVDAFNAREIDTKWQERWARTQLYATETSTELPKYYFLTMYPYPSGDLHIGHWYAATPADAKARYMRMRGYNVLFPVGFDAFGLPAENAAIRHGTHPHRWTMANISRMRNQIRSMGTMFDWEREIVTCDPEYYRWNQWLFIQFFKNGLAYRGRGVVDWCPSCNTTLAREQVTGDERCCERCETPVSKRELHQWFLRITKYAEELLCFKALDWPERVRTMQTNWIGRSDGVEIAFKTAEGKEIWVFTTSIETVFGATFLVLAPEYRWVEQLTSASRKEAVRAYIQQASRQTEVARSAVDKEKTGVFTGTYCTNPYSGEQVPIYVGDYVLANYGTGAVMGVPAHDERDLRFANEHGLVVRAVIAPPDGQDENEASVRIACGQMVNSGPFNGLAREHAREAIAHYGQERAFARSAISYRLRDWLISRQRYWGTPIPIIHCRTCGPVAVPEAQLPVLLPENAEFLPTGESPLKYDEQFRNVACPQCGEPAERETDTMDTFVDSSWYQYRYLSPHFTGAPFDPDQIGWMPVDQYTGGIEHATMHLLYFRFFTKAMRDIGLISFNEPVIKLNNQGMILGPDGQKMSKSRGNVINPDEIVALTGADAFRCYLMFIGPWEDGGPYRVRGIEGITRWLNRLWNVVLTVPASGSVGQGEGAEVLHRATNTVIRLVTEDIEEFRFNTALAKLMEYTNLLVRIRILPQVDLGAWWEAVRSLVLMIAPLAPHISEELWHRLGGPYSVHTQAWPNYDMTVANNDRMEIAVQVDGATRYRLSVRPDADEDEIRKLALASEPVRRHLQGASVERVVYVPGRVMNFVRR